MQRMANMDTEAGNWLHYLWGMWSEKTTASKTDITQGSGRHEGIPEGYSGFLQRNAVNRRFLKLFIILLTHRIAEFGKSKICHIDVLVPAMRLSKSDVLI